ncbi:MAG: hypothetical protein DSY53_00340, partial [Persephonella sp.]
LFIKFSVGVFNMVRLIKLLFKLFGYSGLKTSKQLLSIIIFLGKVAFIIFLGALALGIDLQRENLKS